MGECAQRLKAHIGDAGQYDIPHGEIAAIQLEAAAELFRERRGAIKFLGHRAEESGVMTVRGLDDLVGLLFAHTTYKSYPEKFLSEGKWALLAKWVDSMSTHRVAGVDFGDVAGIDDWIARMADAGHYLACSSGTTGKSAILNASIADLEWAKLNSVNAICWAASVRPERQFIRFSAAAVAATPRTVITGKAMGDAFVRDDVEPFRPPMPPITLGQMTAMVALRKRIADGVASPEEIAGFEQTSAARARAMAEAIPATAKALVAARGERLMIAGMWTQLHQLALEVRALGCTAGDFGPGNLLFCAGGLKGAVLPQDYREFVLETFNISPEHVAQSYSMQEIGSAMPRCRAGRYHLPPWLICLLLDRDGENLLDVAGKGEVEGRAGFFDLAIDGRWNGVISGDRIAITHDRCDCGNRSPSIRDDIARYADLPGGDKITCAGTLDAYVRGIG